MVSFLNLKLSEIKKINIFLIICLPISLLAGSLVINLNILLIIIFFLVDCKRYNNFFFLRDKNFYFLLIIYIYLIFNSIFIAQDFDSLVRSIGFIRFFLLAYAIFYYLNIENRKYKNLVLKYWSYIFFIVTADLIFEVFLHKNILGFSSNYPGRLAGFTGEELKVGGYYFGFILLTLSYLLYKNKYSFLIFFCIFIIVALLIGERANFIKILIIYLFFTFFVAKNIGYKNIFIFLSTILVLFIFIYNYNSYFNTKIRSYSPFHIIDVDKKEKLKHKGFLGYQRHFLHYSTAYKIIKKNPVFGVGMKKFRNESTKEEYNPAKGITGYANHPHQTHFELLSELGIIGYLLIILNILNIIWSSFKNNTKKDLFITSSILFMIATLIPIIPSGSFFTTFTATIFWINYSFLITNSQKIIKNNG